MAIVIFDETRKMHQNHHAMSQSYARLSVNGRIHPPKQGHLKQTPNPLGLGRCIHPATPKGFSSFPLLALSAKCWIQNLSSKNGHSESGPSEAAKQLTRWGYFSSKFVFDQMSSPKRSLQRNIRQLCLSGLSGIHGLHTSCLPQHGLETSKSIDVLLICKVDPSIKGNHLSY